MQQAIIFPFDSIRLMACLLFSCCLTPSAQQIEPDPQEKVFTVVERSPEFPGGFQNMKEYLTKNMHYPDAAAKAHVKGKVVVSFVVDHDGHLTNIDLLVGLGFGCDEEAIRVIKGMPPWKPGLQSGRPMRVKFNVSVAFGAK